MLKNPTNLIQKLKYRSELHIRTLDRIISSCGIPMGAITRAKSDAWDDFFYFCLSKSCKSLRSAKILYDKDQFEDSLTVLRTVYESYLAIQCMMNVDLDFLIERLINKPAKAITLIKYSDSSLDKKIHSELYEYLSGYSHINMKTMRHYLDDPYGFPEFTSRSRLDEFPVILLFFNYLSLLLLTEVIKYECLDPPEFDSTGRQLIGGAELILKYIPLIEIETGELEEFYLNIKKRIFIALEEYLNYPDMKPIKAQRDRIEVMLNNYINPDS